MAELLLGPGGAPPDEPGAKPGGRRGWVALALIVIVAVGVAGWFARGVDSAPATARPGVQPAPSKAPSEPFPVPREPTALAVRFADAAHGYVLIGRCVPAEARRCEYVLRTTEDAGRTWQERATPLPAFGYDQGFSADLVAFGAGSLQLQDYERYWFSADAGRTWRPTSTQVVGTVASVPDGWPVVGACPYQYETGTGCRQPLATVDPATGRRYALASQPQLLAAFGTERAVVARDGSLWITGIAANVKGPTIAVTRDRGRTWHTFALTPPATPLFGVALLTHDGRTAYAFVRAQAPPSVQNVKNGLESVWRTTDGGAHWSRVAPRSPGAQPQSLLGAAMLPDGRLMITTEALEGPNVLYSDDGGRLFRPATGRAASALGWIEELPGRYVAGGLFGGHVTSTDGRRWEPIPTS